MCYIFFFKQKTAYEMRISDWSSDVCSSDLYNCLAHDDRLAGGRALLKGALHGGHEMARIGINLLGARARSGLRHDEIRSEEHTSELQSLMRISYAVFCLKKKNTTINTSSHEFFDHTTNTESN